MISLKSFIFICLVFYRNIFSGKINFTKLKVLIYNLLSSFLKIPKLKYGPSFIWVEASNYCNLACTGCWVPAFSKKMPVKMMGLNEYKKLVDEIQDSVMILVLQMSGESFLNKDIFDMIAYADKKRIIVWISTNGSYKTPDDWGERIVNSGLDMIYFSISGTTQQEYEKYHRKGDLSYIIENIKKIQRAKKRLGSKDPYLSFRMLMTPDSSVSEKDAMRFAKANGVGLDFRYLTMDYIFDGADDPGKKKIKVSSLKNLSEVKNGCPTLWIAVAVQSNGNVLPCCCDYFGVPSFGNINDESLLNIWKGEDLNSFRGSILRNRMNIGSCAHCDVNVFGFKEPFSRKRKVFNITFHE